MITGVHAMVFGEDAEKARAFFRDVLDLDSVDAGEGWLIFALPPAELAAHPTDGPARHELYLMCDDIGTTVRVPGGGELGLYEPRHVTPLR